MPQIEETTRLLEAHQDAGRDLETGQATDEVTREGYGTMQGGEGNNRGMDVDCL